jgi:phage tail-like protein
MTVAFIQKSEDYKFKYDYGERLLTPDKEAIFDILDGEFQTSLSSVRHFTDLNDPDKIPEGLLDLYLLSMGFRPATDFPGITLTAKEKRKLAKLAVPLYRQKGTASGIVNIIRLILGIESAVLTQYNVNIWKLGVSLLGVDTILFPTGIDGSRALYTFDIELITPTTQEQNDKIIALVRFMKPIHTHIGQIIQPPIPPDHWELGVSLLGDTTDLHE